MGRSSVSAPSRRRSSVEQRRRWRSCRLSLRMTRPTSRPSLRTELLVNFAILAVAALVFAVGAVVLLYDQAEAARGALYISLLVAADVVVARRVLRRGRSTGSSSARCARRPPPPRRSPTATCDAASRRTSRSSCNQLAESVNRMTDRLLEEQTQLVRAEKLASVGRLAAGIAHEIGNPLGALNGYTPHPARPRRRRSRSRCDAITGFERETARIDRIVRGLLDYARPRKPTPVADRRQRVAATRRRPAQRAGRAAARLAAARAGERVAARLRRAARPGAGRS